VFRVAVGAILIILVDLVHGEDSVDYTAEMFDWDEWDAANI
jgi:hypothetical protein